MGGPIAARALALALAVTAALACTTQRVAPRGPADMVAAPSGADDVEAIVRLALALDAAGDVRADTLYASDALVIGNARVRLAAPRFAGLVRGTSGRVTVTAASATVEGRVAWVLVDYRWFNPAERRAEVGRATVICERRERGWKIVHAHSSQPLPWEP